ncbi:glycoside hydrolase family 3 protein [Rheinheimera sp. 1928-s]|uniref:glycoside hydrolase family 3 N-terminal domain-containing protein n=1 Tax=Rheinheimera sp. 1928-s TaxID=3033803 RepID=UPI0026272088|nr:glycoside hydrolase family 3 protein [Rheinheimera sp. 1928-s]MDF3126821.1 glycoside hydrolase family 3 protein [Rheinheimera sp. 1928-s]
MKQYALLLAVMTLSAGGCVGQKSLEQQELRRQIGQKLMIDLRHFCAEGSSAQCKTDLTELPKEFAEAIQQLHLGGVILFANNLKDKNQIRRLTADLQAASSDGLPLLIGIDQEGGRVARLPTHEFPAFAGNMAIGATLARSGNSYATAVGRSIAQQLSSLGINLNFAPSLDVNNNPANPVINARSFGDNPVAVAAAGGAMLDAMQQAGVLGTIKHFPGHGDTHVDSHTGLPLVEHDKVTVEAVDLYPFRQLIKLHQPAMVMTAHIQYPALDNSSLTSKSGEALIKPATLSRAILTDLLREDMGFNGIIITDALNMAGISQFFTPSEAVIQTFAAGADIALMPYEIKTLADMAALARLIDQVVLAVQQGQLNSTEIAQSAQRITRLRQQLNASPAQTSLPDTTRLEHDLQLERQLAEASLTQVGTNKLQLPLNLSALKLHLIAPDQTKCQSWMQALSGWGIKAKSVTCSDLTSFEQKLALQQIAQADLVLGSLISPAQSAAELGVLADLQALPAMKLTVTEQKKVLVELLQQAKAAGKKTVMVSLRTPYELSDFANSADLRLATYSYNQKPQTAERPFSGPAYDAVIGFLLGEVKSVGQLPVLLK